LVWAQRPSSSVTVQGQKKRVEAHILECLQTGEGLEFSNMETLQEIRAKTGRGVAAISYGYYTQPQLVHVPVNGQYTTTAPLYQEIIPVRGSTAFGNLPNPIALYDSARIPKN
jgi:hypothetical protein